VFIDDLLILNPEAGYLIIKTSKAPEHGGLLAGALMDHQIMGDLFCHVDEVGQVFYTRYGVA
jgi:hypothetical protein